MRALSLGLSVLLLLLAACSGESEPGPTIQPDAPPDPTPAPRPVVERAAEERHQGMLSRAEPGPIFYGECEPGQSRVCRHGISLPGGPPLAMHCKKSWTGEFRFDASDCATPLVVAFDEVPVAFTKPAGLFAVGPFDRTEWVSARTPWLGLDRNGSGCIDDEQELFRFDRLSALDGNGDGRIDAQDEVYSRLVLWFDRDQDRRCSVGETVGLAAAGIVALDLGFTTPKESAFGSHEGERSSLSFRGPSGELRRGRLVDVYLAPLK